MNDYHAPTVDSGRNLRGALIDVGSDHSGDSDAEIKHGVESIAYEAPEISAERELDGRLQNASDVS